jgi:predicted RNA-binding Zn-ribbon protein involved in translation (DUF1610 family)
MKRLVLQPEPENKTYHPAAPIFAGRSSSPASATNPSAFRFFYDWIGLGFGLLVGAVVSFAFLPLGLLLILGSLLGWQQSRIKRATKWWADCPSCQRHIWFTANTAFPCPYCKRTLMRDGGSVYDITEGR